MLRKKYLCEPRDTNELRSRYVSLRKKINDVVGIRRVSSLANNERVNTRLFPVSLAKHRPLFLPLRLLLL